MSENYRDVKLSLMVFKIFDPLFMKLGKINARRIARKDNTENLLEKRKNQESLIINTYRKDLHALSFSTNSIIKAFLFVVIPFLITMTMKVSLFSRHNIIDVVFWIITLTSFGGGLFSLSHSTSYRFKKIIVERLLLQDSQSLLKQDNERFIVCIRRLNFTYILEILTPLVLLYLIVDSLYDKQSSYAFNLLIVLLVFEIVFYLSIFIEWCVQYILITTLAHCNDHGKTEKETKKETEESLSYAQT